MTNDAINIIKYDCDASNGYSVVNSNNGRVSGLIAILYVQYQTMGSKIPQGEHYVYVCMYVRD
jgi:hypothetical protein